MKLSQIRQVFFTTFVVGSTATIVACQSLPEQPTPQPMPEKPQTVTTPEGVVIRPYEREEIKRQSLQVVVPQQSVRQKLEDGRRLPAFQKLMQQTKVAYKQGQFNQAETVALQAQRLAPQAAETYLYLALIANQKKQPANAEALARRGLSYAQSDAMKRQLWLVIQKAAQQQNNAKSLTQAQQALKDL